MQEPVKTVCFGAGRGGPGKSESANSGATKPVPFLKNGRTNDAALAELAHEKQWTVAIISGRTFLAQPAPCSGQKFSTVRATVRGGPFLVKTLSRALPGDPNHQNMFRPYTTSNPHITTDLSYPSW